MFCGESGPTRRLRVEAIVRPNGAPNGRHTGDSSCPGRRGREDPGGQTCDVSANFVCIKAGGVDMGVEDDVSFDPNDIRLFSGVGVALQAEGFDQACVKQSRRGQGCAAARRSMAPMNSACTTKAPDEVTPGRILGPYWRNLFNSRGSAELEKWNYS